MRSRLAVVCLMALLLTPATWAEENAKNTAKQEPGPSAPVALAALTRSPLLQDLDALFLLQDATARGRQDAAALQKPLLVSIGKKLREIGTEDPNMLAPLVAGYVLSGGDPAAAERLSKAEAIESSNRQLLEGAFLFMQGSRAEAAQRLEPIDASRLPARIAGRVALTQALLAKQPADRQQGFAAAIAHMPGTLIEESALRRSALAFAEVRDETGFWRRLERYQRRFPDSLYARSFWEETLATFVAWHAAGDGPAITRLDVILQDIGVSRRRGLYLHLARRAAFANNGPLAVLAAGRAHRLAVPGAQEDQAARLYLALYAVATEQADTALGTLQSLNPELLNPDEQALREAGLAVARQINLPADEGQGAGTAEKHDKGPLETRAKKLLVEIDQLITEQGS